VGVFTPDKSSIDCSRWAFIGRLCGALGSEEVMDTSRFNYNEKSAQRDANIARWL